MATTWALIGNAPRSVVSTQTVTESAPTLATEGMSLDEIAGFTVHISCDSSQSFNNAASTFLAYRYSYYTARWSRSAEHDITVGVANVGVRDFVTSYMVTVPRGRVAHIANTVGVTGGNLTLTYEASYLSGRNG